MKKLPLFLVAAGVVAAMTACNVQSSYSSNWSDGQLPAATNVMQTAEIPASLKQLNVDNRFGAIHIVGTTNGSSIWTWNLDVRARTDSIAEQIASAVTCTAKLDGDQLSLTVSLPGSNDSGATADLMKQPHNLQSDFEITVPESVAVHLQNRFGRIAVSDLAGNVEAINQNGRIDINNIDAAVHARTSFDSLSVSNTGSAALQNQNGKIWAAGIRGTLDAHTSFALLFARDVQESAGLTNQNGTIHAISIHGSLDAKTSFDSLIANEIGGSATLRNKNGRIEATDVGGHLEADTSFASLAARDINGPVQLRDQNGDIKATQVKGDANIRTSFATLTVSDIQGDAILKDQNGEVNASGVTGAVKASTSFADIEVTGAGSNFACNNQNGSIRLHATSATVTNIEANTSFATLEVHLPGSLKPAILANTTFANIDSDFPMWNNPSSPDALNEIANAAARVSLHNQNGKIRVVRD